MKEVYTWFNLLRPGATVFFDDVDCAPYVRGRRKDSASAEIALRGILEAVKAMFLSNLEQLQLSVDFGSTGLAIMTKNSPRGTELKPPSALPRPRSSRLMARVVRRISRKLSRSQ